MSELEAQVKSFVRSGRILQEEAALVNLRDILTFVLSGLGERMEAAFAEKKLYREQPFTLGVCASEINSDYPEDEPILVSRFLFRALSTLSSTRGIPSYWSIIRRIGCGTLMSSGRGIRFNLIPMRRRCRV